jgi:predicted nucleotidyltransferase
LFLIKAECLNEKLTRLVVFGSMAIANYKQGSDIDLAFWGLKPGEVRKLNIRLIEYPPNLMYYDSNQLMTPN